MSNKKNEYTDIQVQMDNLIEDYKTLSQEIEDLVAIKDAKIEKIEHDCRCRVEIKEDAQNYIVAQLKVLAEQVPQKETKTQSKVALLSGDLIIKKPKQTLVADKEALIEWAKEHEMDEYIDEKVVQSFKWKEYKGNLDIVDGQVVDRNTGEVITTGVSIEHKAEEVVIK